MLLPSQKQLIAGIQKWRLENLNGASLQFLFNRYTANCKKNNDTPYFQTPDKVRRILAGAQKDLKFNELSHLLKFFEVPSFDSFLDYCKKAKISDVTVSHSNTWNVSHLSEGCSLKSLPKDTIKNHRIRFDFIDISAKSETEWNSFHGEECLIVLEGAVSLLFENDSGESPKEIPLNENDAVVFPSALSHRLKNHSTIGAKVGIAKLGHAIHSDY